MGKMHVRMRFTTEDKHKAQALYDALMKAKIPGSMTHQKQGLWYYEVATDTRAFRIAAQLVKILYGKGKA